jgi:hypothetical protein
MLPMLGLLVGVFIVGPAFCWLIGLFNPIGWMGVPPWRVPPCECPEDHYRRLMHDRNCPISKPPAV